MKNRKSVGVWRPLLGVAIAGGLALGVNALAGPRGDQSTPRGSKDKVGTEPIQLVTGDQAQINAVVAGVPPPATAVMEIVPVAAKVGPQAYTISGSSISAANGGFRAWFEVKLSNWDSNQNGLPELKVYQFKINGAGYMSGNGDPLDRAVVACAAPANAGNATCAAAFGEPAAKCDLTPGSLTINTCNAGYNDKGGARADAWCNAVGGGCFTADTATSTLDYNWFAIADAAGGRPETDGPGFKYWGGTLVLDIPPGARGTYCVDVNHDETFMADTGTPPVDIPTAQENGFCVVIETGSCCYGLGGPLAGCSDKLKASECGDDEPAPFIWSKNKTCAQGCVECVNDAGCNDGDSCTTERCDTNLGVCVRGTVSGWDLATECCDGNGPNPSITTLDDGDACTVDTCKNVDPVSPRPPARENGVADHNATGYTGPCDDGNPCTTADHCDGARTEAAGGCSGTDINSFTCVDIADCPAGAQSCTDGICVCTLTPKVTFELNSPAPKTCAGSPVPGVNGSPCAKDTDCQGGFCDLFANGANCYDLGAKISARVHIGASASPVNGGQFLINYDPTCVRLNSATCLAPYTENLMLSANSATGQVFIACGIDPFGGVNGPLGNVDIVGLNLTMVGECANCEMCFGGFGAGGAPPNPLNTYLVDDEGQAVNIEGQCKEVSAKGDLVLNVPSSIKVNSDCDKPAAEVSWDAPSASFSCGDTNIECQGAHESGLHYSQAIVNGGGLLPQGASSFCCYASAKDKCDQATGCRGRVNDCPGAPNPDGCWTVEVNDEISMDIHVQLEPPIAAGELTRCIEFCLYGACTDEPQCFTEDLDFGGLLQYVGKTNGKIKAPKGKWGCITAQDQLHSLRSCVTNPDCIDGQLVARFKGDPAYGGNWLIQGNLDAWKKDVEKASQDTIDILDFGMFVSQFGVCYTGPTPGCHDGPNADINGDGCVTAADYNFILRNFLESSKQCCCGPRAASVLPTLVEISVDELKQMGLGDLAVADLNADGVVNAQDMDVFAQGARPVKNNDRKGVKGLRSGR